MEKTRVKVEFMILGDEVLPDDITKIINITPTFQWRKGDSLKSGRVQECSGWELSTEYEESLDVSNQLNKIICNIKKKRMFLKEICTRKGMESKFCIVIKIENGEVPAMQINRETIELAKELNAEFDFDLYANPYPELE